MRKYLIYFVSSSFLWPVIREFQTTIYVVFPAQYRQNRITASARAIKIPCAELLKNYQQDYNERVGNSSKTPKVLRNNWAY